MITFKDSLGREWMPKLTLGILFKAKQELNIDLLDMKENGGLSAIGKDLIQFFNVMFLTVEEQAKEKKLTIQDFVDGFQNGDDIEKMQGAFMEVLFPFFQGKKRELLKKVWNLTNQTTDQALTQAMERIDKVGLMDSSLKQSEEQDLAKTPQVV